MGYIRHHAIAVTSFNNGLIKKAHEKAIEIFQNRTSNILDSNIKGFKSFFIAPDGSKEGWVESNIGDVERKMFIDWIKEYDYSDGSNDISFCEFFYGDDYRESAIETEFIPITQKAVLIKALQNGEKEAITTVMDELNRLENVIKDYEIGIKQLNNKFNGKIFKRPNKI